MCVCVCVGTGEEKQIKRFVDGRWLLFSLSDIHEYLFTQRLIFVYKYNDITFGPKKHKDKNTTNKHAVYAMYAIKTSQLRLTRSMPTSTRS